ncbi:MAG: repeat protein, partial [Conexibacter sp.]|nr:repeat protein [Conexibacter sp.]
VTPSASNSWGLGAPLAKTVTTASGVAGALCVPRVTTVTDAGGRSAIVSYATRPTADQNQLTTAITGGLSSTATPIGTVINNRLTGGTAALMTPPPVAKITDHAGRDLTFAYTDSHLTGMTEVANAATLAPAGDKERRWAFSYEAADGTALPRRLSAVTEDRDAADGGPRSTAVAYVTRTGTSPAVKVPGTITDRRSKATSYGFSAEATRPRTLTITDARSKVWSHTVDVFGRPTRVADPLGNAVDLAWDQRADGDDTPRRNELTRTAEGVTTTDVGAVTTMTYEHATGMLTSQTTFPDGEATPATKRTTQLDYKLSRGAAALRPATDPADSYVADLVQIQQPRALPGGAHVGTKFTIEEPTSGDVTGNVTQTQDLDGTGTATNAYCNGTDCPRGLIRQETDEVGNITTYDNFDPNGLPQTVVDPKGNASPGVTSPTPAAHRWLLRYDAVGNLLSSSDPRNTDAQTNPTVTTPAARYTTKFTYDAFDRAITKVTPKKSSADTYITENYTYDRNGNLVGDTNPGTGRTTTATFSASDQPLTVTQTGWARTGSDPRGNTYTTRPEVTTFSYDDTNLLVSRTDPRGASGVPAGGGSPSLPYTTEWTRDPAGRVVAESRHATSTVHVQSFALDPRGNIVGQNDAARNNDPDGNPATNDALTPQAAADAAASAIATSQLSKLRTSMAYDRADELVAQTERPAPTDSTGSPRTNKYVYDVDGNLVKQILPRDDHDVPAGFTSGAGNVARTYTYDHRDQLLSTVDPLGATTAVKRRADGNVIAQTTPRGVANGTTESDGSYRYFTTHYTYDPAGDLLTRSVPFSPNQYGRTGDANNDYKSWKVSYTRDAVGNPTTIVDGRNKSITNTFLDSGQLESTSRPSWWSLSWGSSTGAPDPGRRYTDPATSEQLPVGGPQVGERPTPLTGADSSSGQSDATAQGKFGAVTPAGEPSWLPRGGATLLSYDDDGRLTSVTDAALSVSRIDYDPTGRVVGTTQPLGASAGATLAAGDPTPCTRTTASCDGVIAHRYDYDLDGNITKSALLGDTSWHSDLTYDSFDRALNRTDPGASAVPSSWTSFSDTREETQYTYDANDNLVTRVTPRGVASPTAGDYEYNYSYDTLDRLTSETNHEGDRWGYAWDVDDELLRELTPNGSAVAAGSQDTYKTLRAYDAADRLLTEQGPTVGGVRDTSTYTYFPDGTMASRTDPGGTAVEGGSDVARLTSYDYDGRGLRNRTTQGHAASGGFSTAGTGPRTTLTEYDANGNLRRFVDPSGVTMSGTGASQSWTPTNPDVIGDNLTSTASNDAVHATVYDYTDRTNSYSAGESGEPTAIYQPRASTSDPVLAEKVDFDPLAQTRTIWTIDNVNASSPFSVHTSYDRLPNGWISSSQDFATATTQINSNTYNYDQAGSQLSWKLDPDVTVTTNKISKIDREYWPNGAMKTRTGSAVVGSTTSGTPRSYSYWYDPNEALVGVHDPAHSRMVYSDRDGAERTTSVVQRYGTGSSDENAGTLAWQRGRDSAFTYDHDGNVTLRRTNGTLNRSDGTMADPTSGSPRSYTRFTYDPEDKETIGAFYEPSKLTGSPTIDDSTCAAGGSPPAGVRCVRTTYHPSGQRRTRRQQDDTLVTTYFDDFGQPTERRRRPTGASDIVTSYVYDVRGNRLSDLPGVGTYTYNARNQLASWKRGTDFNANGVDHHDWTIDYTRNTDGSIEHTTEKQAGGSLVRTKTSSYTGQRLDNVKTTLPSGGTPTWDVYGYNEFRSTVGVQTSVSSTTAPTFAVPSAVRSEDCSAALPTTASDTTLYCYDEFDRLTRQRSPGAAEQQQFEYDGMDRRDNRTDHVGATADKSGYKYIGATSTISGQQIATGATTSSAMSYDRDSANAPLAVTLQATGSSMQTTKAYATDANGNPTGLEESNGTVPGANRYVYDPYGDLDVDANAGMSGDAATNPLRFNGFDYDSAVKTYDMQARDYRPSVGRFLQSDRYESAQSDLSLIADPLTQNRYDFAGNDPVGSVEFDGHDHQDSWHEYEGGRANDAGQGSDCKKCTTNIQKRPKDKSTATYVVEHDGTYSTTAGVTYSKKGSGPTPKAYRPAESTIDDAGTNGIGVHPAAPDDDARAAGDHCLANAKGGGCGIWKTDTPAERTEGLIFAAGLVLPEVAPELGLARFAGRALSRLTGRGGAVAAKGGAGALERLPEYAGGKTSGILDTGSGEINLLSGYKGPSAELGRGTPGMNGNIKSHVEAHAAAVVRQQGLDEATLYINRVPCPGVRGCDAMLPRMLPRGARLHVYGPNGFRKTYTGLPDG